MAKDATRYREDYEAYGFSKTHRQAISWVAPGSRVLELGCASGYLGRALIEKGCRVTGVEFDPAAAREARQNGLEVKEGSLEDPRFRASFSDKYDFVLATDVLEHLREPALVLEDFKRWIGPGGHAIISVPNIATWAIRCQLFFRGDFEYQETGILDRTHVHFFTWRTLHKLLDQQEWTILETMVESWQLPLLGPVLVHWPRRVARLFNKGRGNDGAFGTSAQGLLGRWSLQVQHTGERAASALGKNWPNLCASHMAMLLRPPAVG